jgi:FkbM family methyltransferase
MPTRNLALRALTKLRPSKGFEVQWERERLAGNDAFLDVLEAMVGPGDVAYDIGASYGYVTAQLARLVGESGRVHAFDPHPERVQSLERVRAGRESVTVHALALSDREGVAMLHIPVHEGVTYEEQASLDVRGVRRGAYHAPIPVQAARLDSLVGKSIEPPSFIKCDVEGHEDAVLRGAEETLRRHRPTVIVEIEQRHHDAAIDDVFGQFLELGYHGHALTEDGLMPIAHFDVERDQLAMVGEDFRPDVSPPQNYVNDFLFVPPKAAEG